MINSGRLRWAGHEARMEEGKSSFKILTDVDGRTILEWTLNAGNWVDSAQDRNYWRALVNAALNLRVP